MQGARSVCVSPADDVKLAPISHEISAFIKGSTIAIPDHGKLAHLFESKNTSDTKTDECERSAC